MRRYLHILANSTLLLGAFGGFCAGLAAGQSRSTTPAQTVSRTFDFWSDDWNVIIENMSVHHGSAVQPAATLSGYAFTAEAAAAIAARGMVSAAAIARVRNDMVLTEALVRVSAPAQLVGADAAPWQIADRLAARLAPMAGPAPSDAGQDASLVLLRRALNDAAASEAGVQAAARAAGGLKNLMEVSAAVQTMGGDGNPQDPAFVNELRRSSREHIVTRAAANGLGLPPDLANRHAQDILTDAAFLQASGMGELLSDPAIQNDIRRMGWHMVKRRQALRSQGLPDDALISAHGDEILRQAAKVAGMGGDPSDLRSYDVIRSVEGGRMTEASGRARLRAIADANGYTPPQGPGSGSGGTSNGSGGGSSPGSGSGPTGGAGSGAGAADAGGSRPPLPGSGGSSGRSSGGSSGTQTTPRAPGASGGPNGGEQGGSGGDSTSGVGDGNVEMVVRITHNSDGSYNASTMMCDGGGNCETLGSTERFTDADGDGHYEGDQGGSSSSKPAEGDYSGDLDDDTNSVNYGYEGDGTGDGGESGSADPPADDDSAGYASPEARHFLGAMQSYSVIMIAIRANTEGNMVALMAGDFLTGTGDSTPTPDGGVAYTRPTGDVPIRDYLSNPGQAQPPLPASPGAAPTPTPNPNQINPSPDSTTGGPPIQMPVIQLPPPPVPGAGGRAPAPAPRR